MLYAPLAQWIEHRPSKPRVVGSNPTGRATTRRDDMKFFSSSGFSLFCAIFNSVFAIGAFMDGRMGWAALGTVFAVFCFNNYLKAR